MSETTPRADRRVKHGMWRHPLYGTWIGMLARCGKPNDPVYKNYGGRGIKVCERWQDLRLFIADIERDLGPRPDGCTLDRYPDNDGNYEPGNVRWATAKEQAANRRPILPGSERYISLQKAARQQWQERPWHTETCEYCGADYETNSVSGSERLKFCSPRCCSAERRASGLDDIEYTCHQCGGTYTANRYGKIRHCSRSCAAKCQHRGGCPR